MPNLDPPIPHDPAPTCDACGQVMAQDDITEPTRWQCGNKDCPIRFEEGTDAHRLAVIVSEQNELIERLRRKVRTSSEARNV